MKQERFGDILTKQSRAEIYLLLITIIWGSTFPISKSLLEDTTPLCYTGFRFLLAAGILLIFYFRRLSKIPLSTLLKGSVLALFLFFGFVLQTIGLQYTTASKSAFITGLLVILTPIVHYFVQHFLQMEKKLLRIGNVVGVLFSTLGLYFITLPQGSEFNFGDGLTLCCAFLFAFYIVYLDFASKEPDKLQLTYVQFWVCGVLGLLSAWIFEDVKVNYTTNYFLSIAYLIIFATIVAMWVQNRFQGDTTPTRAAVIFSAEPVVAAVCAYYLRNEILGVIGVMGAVIIIIGVLVSELSEKLPTLKRSIL